MLYNVPYRFDTKLIVILVAIAVNVISEYVMSFGTAKKALFFFSYPIASRGQGVDFMMPKSIFQLVLKIDPREIWVFGVLLHKEIQGVFTESNFLGKRYIGNHGRFLGAHKTANQKADRLGANEINVSCFKEIQSLVAHIPPINADYDTSRNDPKKQWGRLPA